MIGTQAKCDRYELEWYKASYSKKWQDYYKQSKWLIDYIVKNTRLKLHDMLVLDIIDELAAVYDTIQVIVGNFTLCAIDLFSQMHIYYSYI